MLNRGGALIYGQMPAKSERRKARIASRVNRATLMPLQWVTEELQRGTSPNINHAAVGFSATHSMIFLLTPFHFALMAVVAGALSLPARANAATASPQAFEQELRALEPPKLVWREINWRSCLLDGIREARAQKKPILLWAFINSDPAEERC